MKRISAYEIPMSERIDSVGLNGEDIVGFKRTNKKPVTLERSQTDGESLGVFLKKTDPGGLKRHVAKMFTPAQEFEEKVREYYHPTEADKEASKEKELERHRDYLRRLRERHEKGEL